ncbi:phosphoesterase [Paenibacillus selenitireducens]|uniref:Phosphoesterase n=1 Tax=Paenibacillus selenitireducens TaxID=1324314 RepID=A0A1T2X4J4_9BACL|nr:metallophosphoesterase [Paenibacillus selenitireducens]OPA74606.1 phosphoesterase [Paenibacillus selenitireducens]
MSLRFIPVVITFIIINLYVGWHGNWLLSFYDVPLAGTLYWILFWVVALSYLIGRFRLVPGPLGRGLKVVGSYYIAVLEFAVILLPITDLVAWFLHLAGIASTSYVPFLSGIVGIVLIALLLRGSWNAWSTVKRTYELEVPKIAGGLKELRILVASDIHLGNIVGKRHLRRLILHMRAMQPDLILLPGDVIDDDIEPFMRNNMAKVMKQLHARLGVYAVLGNHEYYGGHIEQYVKEMKKIGIQVLRDETVLVDNLFYVVGRKDKAAEGMDPEGRAGIEALLAPLDHSKPIIVMDHQPYHFDKAAHAGADLLLSGHTHRGQFAPNHWITRRLFELDWGYMQKGMMHVIVSSGFGSWGPPIRLASRSEVIEIVLHFHEKK